MSVFSKFLCLQIDIIIFYLDSIFIEKSRQNIFKNIADMSLTLSVLTLNIWGIPIISKDKDVRVRSISEKLAQSDYDIISLQEVWSEYDYNKIKERISSQYPYSHYFYSGVVGSGMRKEIKSNLPVF